MQNVKFYWFGKHGGNIKIILAKEWHNNESVRDFFDTSPSASKAFPINKVKKTIIKECIYKYVHVIWYHNKSKQPNIHYTLDKEHLTSVTNVNSILYFDNKRTRSQLVQETTNYSP